MESLRAVLDRASQEKIAIAHFNVSDFLQTKAVVEAAQETSKPIIIGLSEGEREFIGVKQISALIKAYRQEVGVPIFLNADHTHSLKSAIDAVQAGFDSVVFDLSALSFEENIRQTREAVYTLKAINPDLIIEGEIGDIGTGSSIHNLDTAERKPLTTPEEAKHFVEQTGVDVLAPAVGNMHGMSASMARGETKKRLNLTTIADIKEATGIFITLHGASGTDDSDLQAAIAAGINMIHINTELRVAWRQGLEQGFKALPNEVVPYKVLPYPLRTVKEVAASRISLFSTAH